VKTARNLDAIALVVPARWPDPHYYSRIKVRRLRQDTHNGRGIVNNTYVHGYAQRERARLQDQAETLTVMLHSDTAYPGGSTVLKAGCGVGAQTLTLARNSPGTRFTSVDISGESVAEARTKAEAASIRNVQFRQADIFALPFAPESFDHVFVCLVREHLAQPVNALVALKRLLKPN